MWSRLSECWLKCFTGGEQLITEPTKIELVAKVAQSSTTVPQTKAYLPLKSNSEDVDAETPGTDISLDLNLETIEKQLEHALRDAQSIVADENLSLFVDKEDVKVWGKVTPRGYVLRTHWQTSASQDDFIRFVRKFDLRTAWDGNVSESKVVATLPVDIAVVYQLYKKVLAVSPRDILIACKTFPHEQACFEVSASIDSPALPAKEPTIRAQLFTGGYYVRSTDSGTAVTAFSEMDFGGSLPSAAIMRMSAMAMPAFVKNLASALGRECRH